jgi:hypothetical protein
VSSLARESPPAIVRLSRHGCLPRRGAQAGEARARLTTRIIPRIVVAPELALAGVAAVSLWETATLDAYAPELSISSTCGQGEDLCIRVEQERPDCSSPGSPWLACFRGSTIDVWTGVPDEWRASIIAHELGHSLGLEHGSAGLMCPERDRSRPCVEDADLAALEASTGIVGTPACVR